MKPRRPNPSPRPYAPNWVDIPLRETKEYEWQYDENGQPLLPIEFPQPEFNPDETSPRKKVTRKRNHMSDFKIVEEQTLDYKRNDQLWLMLIRIKNEYGIEINSRNSKVGRKMAKSRKEAEAMFEHIYIKLMKCNDIYTAWDLMEVGFNFPTVKEMMFVINTRFNKYDFNSLCKLKSNYGYTTLPSLEDMIWENREWDKTIQVFFPGRKIPIAKFIPINDDEDAKFRVELTTGYFNYQRNNS